MTQPAALARDPWLWLGPATLLAGGAAGMAAVSVPANQGRLAMLLPAAVIGAAGLWFALARFELFVLAFIAVRPSLDALSVGGVDPSQAMGFLFLLASICFLIREHRDGVLLAPTLATRAMLLVAAVGTLSALASLYPMTSLQAGLKILGGALMFAVLGQLLATRPDLTLWLARSVLLSAVIPVTVAVTQLGREPTVDASGAVSRVQGTFAHPNPFAGYLAIVIVLAVGFVGSSRWYDRALRLLVVVGAPVALIGTGARGPWFGLVAALGYLLFRRHPRLVIPVAALLVLVALATPSVGNRLSDLSKPSPVPGAPANSLEWRWQYWHELPQLAADRPITGIGLETVQLVTPEHLQPHSVWVQAYTELGVLGVIAVLTLVVTLGLELRQRRRHPSRTARAYAEIGIAIAIGLLVQSLTENLLTQPTAYWYFAAACAYGLHRAQPGPSRPRPSGADVVYLSRATDR